jgi:hypothetical protein
VTAGIEEHHGRIQLTIGKTVLTATLLGNAASRNFAALIPSDLPLRDFAAAEKISDPPARLSPADSPAGATPDIGDIAYYAHPGQPGDLLPQLRLCRRSGSPRPSGLRHRAARRP